LAGIEHAARLVHDQIDHFRTVCEPMRILSFFNQKGGVGKTTATVNIGAAFALMLSHEAGPEDEPGRVLILDLDQQIHTSVSLSGGFFGYRDVSPGPYDNIAGLLMLETERPITEILSTASIPHGGRGNMDFIPSSKKKMTNVESALSSEPVDGLYRLREVLEPIDALYQYVVIDNPPSLGYLACNSLTAATHVVVPIQLEAAALFSLSETLRTIQSIQNKHNPELQLLGILATMCDFRNQEQREFYDSLRGKYGDLVLPPISRRAEIAYASSEGLDIFSFKPSRRSGSLASASQASQEYAAVAEEIRRRMDL
jgi:chromosome partitioning protein